MGLGDWLMASGDAKEANERTGKKVKLGDGSRMSWDGQVFAKVVNSSMVAALPIYNAGEPINQFSLEIQTLINTYGIKKIKKAFSFRNNTDVDNIFKIEFDNFSQISNLIVDLQNLNYIQFAEKVPIYKVSCTNEGAGYWNSGNPANYHLGLMNACNAYPRTSVCCIQ